MRRLLTLLLATLLLFALMLGFGCSKKGSGDFEKAAEGEQFKPPVSGEEYAVFRTNMGDIKVRLFPKQAPKAVENFVTHAKAGYYDGLTFHRVIYDFMIQGGDPKGDGTGGESIWGEPFEDEFDRGLFNFRGALSMANVGDPKTNGSQFFIVQRDEVQEAIGGKSILGYMKSNGWPQYAVDKYREVGGVPSLDGKFCTNLDPESNVGHTVFGQVFEGMDVVDKIAKVNVDQKAKPRVAVVIEKIEIVKMP